MLVREVPCHNSMKLLYPLQNALSSVTLYPCLKDTSNWLAGVQGRKIAEAAGVAQRVDRLADQAGGGSMVTTKSLASFDGEEDEGEVLQRLNVILKVSAMKRCLGQAAIRSVRFQGVGHMSRAFISCGVVCILCMYNTTLC